MRGTEIPDQPSTNGTMSTSVNGEIQRFHIVEIVSKDLSAIQKAVHAWLKKKPSRQDILMCSPRAPPTKERFRGHA